MTVSRATQVRLTAIAALHGLAETQHEQLATIIAELAADEHAPSTVRAGEHAVDAHVADSLSALAVPELLAARDIADVGSGAGFPGLPIAVALPEAQVSLVESQARRCRFLRRACRATHLSNAEVVCSRVEEWEQGRGACDIVLARALAPAAVVLEYAAPLLRAGGLLIDWRGRPDREGSSVASRAARELGLDAVRSLKVCPFPGASRRYLDLYLKVRATPERFPRRAGMARKRPLAQS